MAAPLVLGPVLPVLDYIVHGNVAGPELGQRTHQVFLGAVTLAALPEAQGPFGHHLRLAGKLAVALDDAVVIVSGNEIIVGLGLELTPESEAGLLLGRLQRSHAKANIGHVSVRLPLNLHGRGLAGLQMDGELVAVGVPGRTPAAAHYLHAVYPGALETGIVLDKVIVSGFAGGQGSLIGNLGPHQGYLGKVLDGPFVLIEQAVFLLHQGLSLGRSISARQIQVKDLSQLLVGLGRAPAAQGIGIEQKAVALVGHYHGHAYLGIVLIQFLAEALVVKLTGLLLTQAIEGLVVRRSITDGGAPGLLPFHLQGLEGRAAVQGERGAVGLKELQGSVGLSYLNGKSRRRKHYLARLFGHFEVFASRLG